MLRCCAAPGPCLAHAWLCQRVPPCVVVRWPGQAPPPAKGVPATAADAHLTVPNQLAHCWHAGPVGCPCWVGGTMTPFSSMVSSVPSLSALCGKAHLITVMRCAPASSVAPLRLTRLPLTWCPDEPSSSRPLPHRRQFPGLRALGLREEAAGLGGASLTHWTFKLTSSLVVS
jgi:hypothetical protein